jgi:hypothetical protein
MDHAHPLPPPIGGAEEAAMGPAECPAEAAPPGAYPELHHPPGEAWQGATVGGGASRSCSPSSLSSLPGALHGQPHATAAEHHTLEGGVWGSWGGWILSPSQRREDLGQVSTWSRRRAVLQEPSDSRPSLCLPGVLHRGESWGTQGETLKQPLEELGASCLGRAIQGICLM